MPVFRKKRAEAGRIEKVVDFAQTKKNAPEAGTFQHFDTGKAGAENDQNL